MHTIDAHSLGSEHASNQVSPIVKKTPRGFKVLRSPGIKLEGDDAAEFAQEYLEGYSSFEGT